eukprot:scaffold228591_cov32-Tisochrysis_lutea.AAC.2
MLTHGIGSAPARAQSHYLRYRVPEANPSHVVRAIASRQVITRAYILASRFTMKLVLHNSRMYVFSSFFDSLGLWNTLPDITRSWARALASEDDLRFSSPTSLLEMKAKRTPPCHVVLSELTPDGTRGLACAVDRYGMPERINEEVFISMAKALDFIDPDKLSMTVVLTAMNRFLNEVCDLRQGGRLALLLPGELREAVSSGKTIARSPRSWRAQRGGVIGQDHSRVATAPPCSSGAPSLAT